MVMKKSQATDGFIIGAVFLFMFMSTIFLFMSDDLGTGIDFFNRTIYEKVASAIDFVYLDAYEGGNEDVYNESKIIVEPRNVEVNTYNEKGEAILDEEGNIVTEELPRIYVDFNYTRTFLPNSEASIGLTAVGYVGYEKCNPHSCEIITNDYDSSRENYNALKFRTYNYNMYIEDEYYDEDCSSNMTIGVFIKTLKDLPFLETYTENNYVNKSVDFCFYKPIDLSIKSITFAGDNNEIMVLEMNNINDWNFEYDITLKIKDSDGAFIPVNFPIYGNIKEGDSFDVNILNDETTLGGTIPATKYIYVLMGMIDGTVDLINTNDASSKYDLLFINLSQVYTTDFNKLNIVPCDNGELKAKIEYKNFDKIYESAPEGYFSSLINFWEKENNPVSKYFSYLGFSNSEDLIELDSEGGIILTTSKENFVVINSTSRDKKVYTMDSSLGNDFLTQLVLDSTVVTHNSVDVSLSRSFDNIPVFFLCGKNNLCDEENNILFEPIIIGTEEEEAQRYCFVLNEFNSFCLDELIPKKVIKTIEVTNIVKNEDDSNNEFVKSLEWCLN